MKEVYIEPSTGLAHEIVATGDRVPMRILLRCLLPIMPQMGPSNIGAVPVDCIACIGFVEPPHDMFCVTHCSICIPGRVSCDGVIHSCWCHAEEGL